MYKKLTREQVEQIIKRAQARGERPNFNGAILNRVNLKGFDLNWAEFIGADLRGADLRQANLIWTNFREADLRGANLGQAKLILANLSRANLRGVNMSEACLSGSDLSEAIFDRITSWPAHFEPEAAQFMH